MIESDVGLDDGLFVLPSEFARGLEGFIVTLVRFSSFPGDHIDDTEVIERLVTSLSVIGLCGKLQHGIERCSRF